MNVIGEVAVCTDVKTREVNHVTLVEQKSAWMLGFTTEIETKDKPSFRTNAHIKRHNTKNTRRTIRWTTLKSRQCEKEYSLIERLHGLQQRGIQTVAVKSPTVKRIKNPSQWEQMILQRGNRWLRVVFKYFPIPGYGEKYTREMFQDRSLLDFGQMRFRDYSVCGDGRSQYVNIVNHVRPAKDNPVEALHTVHILGDSTALGFHVMDEDTIGNCLQRFINDMRMWSGKKTMYCTLVYAAHGARYLEIHRRLRDVTIEKGDIVVVICLGDSSNNFMWFCKVNGVPFYDLQPHFNRPHSDGELFIDRRHTNPNGNRKAGAILYNQLFVKPAKLSTPHSFQHFFHSTSPHQAVYNGFESESLSFFQKDGLTSTPEFMAFTQNLEVHWSRAWASSFTGAVVMNCNPFTLGHIYLTEVSGSHVDKLYLFIVEEEKSEFLFVERFNLAKLGVTHLLNTEVIPSGRFIISSRTLPEYFVKEQTQDVKVDASLDLDIFCQWVCLVLNIHVRFVGEEPFDMVTLQYNRAMMEILPKWGIQLQVRSRREISGQIVSASHVRALLKKQKFSDIARLVPEKIYSFLKEKHLPKESV